MIGKALKALREERGLSQVELAKQLDISASAIGMYEVNSREPSDDIKTKIAEYFDVSIDYLLGVSDVRNSNSTKHEDKEFVAFYEGYKDLDDTDKEILKATLDAFVRAKKGDK